MWEEEGWSGGRRGPPGLNISLAPRFLGRPHSSSGLPICSVASPGTPAPRWPAPGAMLPTLGIRDPIVTKPTLQGAEGPEPGWLSQKLMDRSRPRRVQCLPGSIPSLGFIVFKGSPLINHSLKKSYRPPGSRVHTPYSKLEALAGPIYLFIYVSGS